MKNVTPAKRYMHNGIDITIRMKQTPIQLIPHMIGCKHTSTSWISDDWLPTTTPTAVIFRKIYRRLDPNDNAFFR